MRLTAMIAASAAALAMSAGAAMPAASPSYGDRYPDEPALKRAYLPRFKRRSRLVSRRKGYKGSRWAKRASRRGGNPARF